EGDAADAVAVRRQGPQFPAGLDVPEAQPRVVPAAGQGLAVGRERQGADPTPAGGEAAQLLAGGDLPEPGEVVALLAVVAAAREQLAVRRERGREYKVLVREGAGRRPAGEVEQVHPLAVRGGERQRRAVGAEEEPLAGVARVGLRGREFAQLLAGGRVAEVNGVVLRRRQRPAVGGQADGLVWVGAVAPERGADAAGDQVEHADGAVGVAAAAGGGHRSVGGNGQAADDSAVAVAGRAEAHRTPRGQWVVGYPGGRLGRRGRRVGF